MNNKKSSLYILILVASLGYFVDAYDLIVASVVRNQSLIDLNLAAAGSLELKSLAQLIEYVQSFGILTGGIFFGIYGDKFGRIKVLFGSIIIYSIGNILNGILYPGLPFVFEYYLALRFICGFALAAELGAGIVMVSEEMKAQTRGIGTMIIVSFGILGTVLAASMFHFGSFRWQTLFLFGGFVGLLLLVLRLLVHETQFYKNQGASLLGKGNLINVFSMSNLSKKFLLSILVGFPIYFFVSIPIKFANDYAKEIGINKVTVPLAIISFYIALSLGDLFANYISQQVKSRKKVINYYICLSLIVVLILNNCPPSNEWQYHFIYCPMMGFCAGYWALLITYVAEQVGTNYRSTFATSIPNIIRSLFIPITLILNILTPFLGTKSSVTIIGLLSCVIALVGNHFLTETWGKNLDYVEE